ncbi:MAG: dienelactone hydrolase family protein [Rhodospirillales bacterium]|nr:dienelactone hydrolase family protein [Rhodospirillales bacterium]
MIRAAAALLLLATPVAALERVSFPSANGDAIGGVFAKPEGAGPFPAVVLLHGCGGFLRSDGRLSSRDAQWNALLVKRGYAVLHVDSFGPRGLRETCTLRDPPVRPERERPYDAYGGLAWLQARPDIAPSRIGLMGWSNGAMAVLSTLRTDAPARPALAADFKQAVAFYPGCRAVAAVKPEWDTKIPLAILIGEADDWTNAPPCVALAEKTAARGAPVTIKVYPGAYHDFDAPDTKLRVRENVASTRSRTATIGTDPAARDDALARVPALLDAALKTR